MPLRKLSEQFAAARDLGVWFSLVLSFGLAVVVMIEVCKLRKRPKR
jgi:hypothetical protein